MKREFSGRIAVVTGGTGGLGRDLVIALAREECEVFFCGRREDVRETLSRCDGRGHYFRCDLTRPEEVADFVREAAAFRGRIDYLVNNAADDARVRFEEADCEAFDRFVALDLRAAAGVYSIDLKKDEPGLLAACRTLRLPAQFYSAQALAAVPGSFSDSGFVASVTGVGCVCERAAMLGAERLLVPKTICGGVTVAVAIEHWEVDFG